jgi:hemerythrin
MIFPWKDEYCVGQLEIDQQHRLLIELINDLYMAIHENKCTEATSDFLTRLKDYTVMHFETEKEIMRGNNYPSLDEHLSQHDEMILKLAEVESKHARGQFGLCSELIIFLREWLTKHICESDKALAEYIDSCGSNK